MKNTKGMIKWLGRLISNFISHIEFHHFKQSKLTARFACHFLVNALNTIVRTRTCISPKKCETTWIIIWIVARFEATKLYEVPVKVVLVPAVYSRRIERIVVKRSPGII
jgi:hypothetical protein